MFGIKAQGACLALTSEDGVTSTGRNMYYNYTSPEISLCKRNTLD